ncbi:MAG: hypothetical protein BWX86_02007 [Verrucomicrobia bacterium ADurb.Bin122]|nr:MAG: hypothetical protein BWX86_02007 [Verrucomicrobia bacterium ADurb.Bin122]
MLDVGVLDELERVGGKLVLAALVVDVAHHVVDLAQILFEEADELGAEGRLLFEDPLEDLPVVAQEGELFLGLLEQRARGDGRSRSGRSLVGSLLVAGLSALLGSGTIGRVVLGGVFGHGIEGRRLSRLVNRLGRLGHGLRRGLFGHGARRFFFGLSARRRFLIDRRGGLFRSGFGRLRRRRRFKGDDLGLIGGYLVLGRLRRRRTQRHARARAFARRQGNGRHFGEGGRLTHGEAAGLALVRGMKFIQA